jgi:glucose/arabinose dehydrogenase
MTNDVRMPSRMMALVAALLLLAPILGPAPEASAADAVDTVGLVDPDTGIWRLRSETGSIATFFFGDPGDVPFAGDWNCDGIDTPGLYRQSDGYVYLRNTNTQGIADISFFFGNPGDIPLTGDFNGDGCDTVSIYRPSESRVYVINELGDADAGLGSADFDFFFGNPGDTPFTGDFNGDGTDTVGLYRETTGLTYMRLTNTQGNADLEFFFGDPGDRFVGGDWDGNGSASPGVYRPSESRFHLKNTNAQGNADVSFPFGSGSWLPISGRWGDIGAVPPLALDLVASGLSQPLFLDAPTGDDRLFVAEKGGRIRIIENGVVRPTPFLQINGISTDGERGLLGMAFHPDFAVNGRFFVHYTDGSGTSRVVEYFATAGADVADPGPVRTLLTVGQPASNHNGGMIEFGPDDRLFVSLGDGGGSPGTRPSDTNDLLGSILRLDVDATAPNNGAPGNPYQGAQGDDRIWAIGVRNPWRTTVDEASGTFIVADVGQDRREEVNVVALGVGGLDYGWPSMEGSLCYPAGSACSSAGKVLPVVEYPRTEGRSITGGYVYRGSEIPELVGRYFYGDFATGFIRSFEIVGTAAVNHLDHTWDLGTVNRLSSFGTDGSGELYVVSLDGNVYRIRAS